MGFVPPRKQVAHKLFGDKGSLFGSKKVPNLLAWAVDEFSLSWEDLDPFPSETPLSAHIISVKMPEL